MSRFDDIGWKTSLDVGTIFSALSLLLNMGSSPVGSDFTPPTGLLPRGTSIGVPPISDELSNTLPLSLLCSIESGRAGLGGSELVLELPPLRFRRILRGLGMGDRRGIPAWDSSTVDALLGMTVILMGLAERGESSER